MINLAAEGLERIQEVFPAYQSKNIAVVFESSELFVPYLSVALDSLVDHISKGYNYDVLILSNEIKDYDEFELKRIVQKAPNVTLRIINPHHLIEEYMRTAQYSYLEVNYYRMLLPWILKRYDKVINLGADVIINHDIADLFNTKLNKGCYMAGAPDLGYLGRLRIDISPDYLGMTDPYTYVNADVLLLNLREIRRNFSQLYFMNLWQERQLMCAEQDALNLAFDGHVQHLDLRWNVFPERMTSEEHIMHAPEESIAEWTTSLSDPFIIHYAAVPKPWDFPMVGYGYSWWNYARRSVYYEEIIRRMCLIAVQNSENHPQQIGVKGALVNYFKKHTPKWLRPLARKIKRLLKW